LKEGTKVPASTLDVCLHHHEKIDGTGYPHKLAGEQISLFSRMGAVCDVYDAITSTRPYKNAWDPAGSLQRMAQWKGQFDPVIFQAFVKSIGIYPTGTLVKLQSGRLAAGQGVLLDQVRHAHPGTDGGPVRPGHDGPHRRPRAAGELELPALRRTLESQLEKVIWEPPKLPPRAVVR
jgi:hypothetical protein